IRAVATDEVGNVYVAGDTSDPLPWPLTLISVPPAPSTAGPGDNYGFVISFAANGAFRWGVKYQSTQGNERVLDVAVRFGEVAVGACSGCQAGPSTTTAIVGKLDSDTGTPIFTRVLTSPGSVDVNAVDLSDNGALFVTGTKQHSLTIDGVTL